MKQHWIRSNSFYGIAAAALTLLIVTGLAQTIPPFGIFLMLFSSIPILLMTLGAIYSASKEQVGVGLATSGTAAIVLAYVAILCQFSPEAKVLTINDLAHVHLGARYYDEIAAELGAGKWLSDDVEAFTVSYAVEGGQRLVLSFADGEHLSAAMLYPPDGTVIVLGKAPPERMQDPNP